MKQVKTISYDEGKAIFRIIISEDNRVTLERVHGSVPTLTMFNILSQVLIPIANKTGYERKNPYKFDTSNSVKDGVYIEWAEPNKIQGYSIKRQMLFRLSTNGNVLNLESRFIFDILDHFVFIGVISKIGKLYQPLAIITDALEITDYIDENRLKEMGFMNIPVREDVGNKPLSI